MDLKDGALAAAREALAEAGIELTIQQLDRLCTLGLLLSKEVKRPIPVEIWDGYGLQFDWADRWVDFLEFYDDE